jgi:hypothetical protein
MSVKYAKLIYEVNNKGIIYDVSEICKINIWSSLLGTG